MVKHPAILASRVPVGATIPSAPGRSRRRQVEASRPTATVTYTVALPGGATHSFGITVTLIFAVDGRV